MYTVMVTGGLGSGKSTLCKLICEHGAMSMNLDEIYRGLLESNENMIADLADRFGDDILDDSGMVIRSKLAEEAFSDEQSTKDLNAITFPYIMAMTNDYLLDVHCVPRSSSKVLVVEVPLLTEVPEFAQLADEIIAVNVPSDVRLQRAVARGMNPVDALKRLQIQPTDAERDAIADTVCDNSGTEDDLRAWADAWWEDRMNKLDAAESR
ncbi:MAG: dephospho-CoA kinase [Coriobacteriaceae bacterium]|jgi:dephospho-CoA kinase|nr:dephospho-CoA kinase [Coriobacteriaceae bacterium]